jgi:predicted phage terminase large subunit-like protein
MPTATAQNPTATTRSLRPHAGPQRLFLSTRADIAVYGGHAGGGKSWALLADPLRHVHRRNFEGLIFRRTSPEITNPGGLWDEAGELYPLTGGAARDSRMEWRWRTGARIAFRHMQYEKDKHLYQGTQAAFFGIDEATHFTESQVMYLMSRMRSRSGVKCYMRMTCNPDAASWLASFLQWWWDPETGYAIPERSGAVRWFLRRGDQYVWADRREELLALFADEPDLNPRSVTFIEARLEDNPTMLAKNPDYRGNLQALPLVERERLLKGNWLITDTAGSEFPADYFLGCWYDEEPPDDRIALRLVMLDPSKGKTDKADYSAFVSIAVGYDGRFYVAADLAKRPIPQIVEQGVRFIREERPNAFGCEANGFQELLATEFDRQFRAHGMRLPVYTIENHVAKRVRIRALGPLLAHGRLKFRRTSPGAKLLVTQLQEFPGGDHDDGPDALEMGVRLCERILAGEVNDL